jgi:predicted esterase
MRIALALISSLALVSACGSDGSGSGDDGAGDDGAGDDGSGSSGANAQLPAVTGTCPELKNGDVMFAPAGMPPRMVKIAMKADATTKGPLVVYWHATGSAPNEAAFSLGATQQAILDEGGVVAAPYADDTAGMFEWFLVNQSDKQDDFLLLDEVVACFAKAGRIDTQRIHTMGMSAGALQTTAVSFFRSNYIASVATYSGGVPAGFESIVQIENADNKFAAMIFDGGANDDVFNVDFKGASEAYQAMLKASGHYAPICDHGKGHNIPLDAAPSVKKFFDDNPYGAWPSPYAASGLPAGFPTYCAAP